MFKNKTIGFYIGLAGGVVGLITMIFYTAYSASVGHFAGEVFAMLLLGVIGSVFTIFTKYKWAPLLPVLFFSLAFGFYVNDRTLMFEEMINKIYPMNAAPGAILAVVIAIFVLNLVSVAACIAATFMDREKVYKTHLQVRGAALDKRRSFCFKQGKILYKKNRSRSRAEILRSLILIYI